MKNPPLRVSPLAVVTLCGTFLCGCAPGVGVHAPGDPAQPVRAAAETIVTTDADVDADDPALWADERNPSRALLFGTDKSDGLYVHNLDGSVRQFLPDGPLNNVDLRTGVEIDGADQVLVAATDRAQLGVRLYVLDPTTLETRPYGFIPTDLGEPYGFCMGRIDGTVYAIVNHKSGEILQIRIEHTAEGPRGVVERRLRVASQPEGCVVDDEARRLYVGEEDRAVWRFDLSPSGSGKGFEVARVDDRRITADVEGLAILRDAGAKYLIVSSQGDSTFPVFRIEGDEYRYEGRFAVVDGAGIDGVTSTDGLSAWSGPIGEYPEGLLAMHDDEDAPSQEQQNYKLVEWREVKRALNLGSR